MKNTVSSLFLFLFVGILLNSCTPDVTKATIETREVTRITDATAICGGTITSDGGADVTERGVCWSTNPNPDVNDSKTIDAAGTGVFESLITGLSQGNTYYTRAYAKNSEGISYGLQVVFKTKSFSVTTSSIDSLTATTAVSGGIVSSEADSLTVIERGVCWNTSPGPTISDFKTVDGKGKGKYTSSLNDLKPLSTYYIRAYVTNSVGTIYGNELSFSTPSGIIDISTTGVGSVKTFSALCKGKIASDGGSKIIEHGFCWSLSPNPTINSNRSIIIGSKDTISETIKGLLPDSKYYIRSYATNKAGTTYGNELSFKTLSSTVTDIEGNIYNIVAIGTQEWMVENLKTTRFNDGTSIQNVTANDTWHNLNTPAYCWYSNLINNKNQYGALYNWYAVNTGKLCPEGWHIASKAEWTTLNSFMKKNEYGYVGSGSGFSGLPGGCRANGGFHNYGKIGYYWSSTQLSSTHACSVTHTMDYSYIDNDLISWGFSVRCIRD